jgi:hypothetical protein
MFIRRSDLVGCRLGKKNCAPLIKRLQRAAAMAVFSTGVPALALLGVVKLRSIPNGIRYRH